jgi:hypothetical protein
MGRGRRFFMVLAVSALACAGVTGGSTEGVAAEPEPECTVNCDCPQGEFCFYGKCTLDLNMPVYCCDKSGCPPGALCLDGDGNRSRCGEDPTYRCDTVCDCGPAHCCKDNKCLRDLDDPYLYDPDAIGSPCATGVDPTYCMTRECQSGYAAYATAGTVDDFRCLSPFTGFVQDNCDQRCFYSGDCQYGQSCVDRAALPDLHPGALATSEAGVCASNSAAEAVYGYSVSDLLPACTRNLAPGSRCEAGWRPGNVFLIERVVGLSDSCGNGICDFALLETGATCPADCSCGDGFCDTSEVGSCVDCGFCTDAGCDLEKVMPAEWLTLSACGDGVCQHTGTIPETMVNCPLDCDNGPPVADAGPDQLHEWVEGGVPVTLDGSGSTDPDGDALTYTWSGGFAAGSVAGPNPAVTFGEPGQFPVTLTVDDGNGLLSTDTMLVDVNEPPVADADGPYLAAFDESITLIGGGSSDPEGGALTFAWTVEAGVIDIATSVTATYTASSIAGIYEIALQVTDEVGLISTDTTSVVIYDPSGGFVTGGGWIESPLDAYKPDPSLTGEATFGFVSKYKKGAIVPTGNTEFQFHVGDLNFHSSEYDWLVATGSDYAKFKGTGTINGSGEYKFMLWAGDADPDTFRIKIWTEDEFGVETVIYDNGFDQAIGGGSIVIHAKK